MLLIGLSEASSVGKMNADAVFGRWNGCRYYFEVTTKCVSRSILECQGVIITTLEDLSSEHLREYSIERGGGADIDITEPSNIHEFVY